MRKATVLILSSVMLVACGGAAPTPDMSATQTQGAEDLIATLTAEAPTATPAPTDTPTATPPPTPTATHTAASTPVLPSPTPLFCDVLPEGGFLTIWLGDRDLQTTLGCPTSHHPRIKPIAWEVKTSYQSFEHGEMIWSEASGWYRVPHVYVFYADSTYQTFVDYFDPAVDPISGGETPPAGLLEPILGFGKVWRDEPGLHEALGWATAGETPGMGRIQNFYGGQMVWISQTNQTYVFMAGIVHMFDVPFAKEEAMPAHWKAYANPQAGFTFKYPEGWIIEEDYFYETAAGERAKYPTVVLKQIGNENPNDLIVINQRQFQCGWGKCVTIDHNLMGTYSNNLEILTIFDQIVASFEVP